MVFVQVASLHSHQAPGVSNQYFSHPLTSTVHGCASIYIIPFQPLSYRGTGVARVTQVQPRSDGYPLSPKICIHVVSITKPIGIGHTHPEAEEAS